MQVTSSPIRHPSILGPIVLIGLGILVLLSNLGLVGWSAWEALGRLWPLLLIAGGLEILVGRRYRWAAWLIAVTTLVVLVGAVWLVPNGANVPVTGSTIAQPLGSARQARIDISLGSGTLRLTTMDTTTNLVEGRVERRIGEDIEQGLRMEGDTAVFTLRSRQRPPWVRSSGPGPTWDIGLNRQVPTQLTVATGAGQSTLDVRRMRLSHLAVSAGAGQTFVTLPESGVLDAQLSMGAGQTVISLPPTMAARLHVSSGIGNQQVQGDFQRDGEYYVSPTYATASNRVDLDVSGGVGSIVIRVLDE